MVLHNASKTDKNYIAADILRSQAPVLGSPTISKGIPTSIASLLEEIQGLCFLAKKAAVFDSSGWSGEANGVLARRLKEAGFEVVDEGLKIDRQPDKAGRDRCREYDRELAARLD